MIKEIVGVQSLPLTPFTDANDVDEAAYRRELEFGIQNGVHGFVVGSKYGEYSALSVDEARRLLAAAVDQVRGRALVGLGIISKEIDLAAEMAQFAERAGADYVMISPPYPDSENMLGWLRAVAGAVDISIMVYDCVYGPWGQALMSVEEVMIPLAAEFENVKATKTTNPPERTLTLKENTDLNVICGWEMMDLLAFQYGASGMTSSISTFMPKHIVEMHRLLEAGDVDGARDLYYREILPVHNWKSFDPFGVAVGKQVLVWRGIFSNTRVRPPNLPISQARIDELRHVCKRAGVLD